MSICKIHGTKLKRIQVPISYGLPMPDGASAVREKLFPHSKRSFQGGCVIDFDNPRYQTAMVCQACREAEAIWRKETDVAETESGARDELSSLCRAAIERDEP